MNRRRLDQALALVFLDHAAVLAREALEVGDVEAAAGHHQTVRLLDGGVRTGHRGDDIIDVFFDIDAGFALEFRLTLLLREHDLEPLAELGVHHLTDVGVGDDRGIGGDVTQLRGS